MTRKGRAMEARTAEGAEEPSVSQKKKDMRCSEKGGVTQAKLLGCSFVQSSVSGVT